MESKADELVKAADNHLPGKWTLFGADTKREEAAEMLARAGNAYKVAKNWESAAESFSRAAGLQKQIGNASEGVQYFLEAARSYRHVAHDRAIEVLSEEVLPEFLETGKMNRAAKLYVEIAEMHESDTDLNEALKAYQQAADLHLSDNDRAAANKCLLKVALLSANEGSYDAAVETFEQVGSQCLESHLLKFNAKGHFLNAGLCILAQGPTKHGEAEEALIRYRELDYSFGDCREGRLLNDLVEASKELDQGRFTDVVYEYDQISKLDAWKTTILLRIKNTLIEAGKDTVDIS